MYQDKRISIYKGVKDRIGNATKIGNIGYVGDPIIKKSIEALRKLTGKEKDEAKKKLPAVTWSGLFEEREGSKLLQYSDLICIDIDPNQIAVFKSLCKSYEVTVDHVLTELDIDSNEYKKYSKKKSFPDSDFQKVSDYFNQSKDIFNLPIEKLEDLKAKLRKEKFVFRLFTSPSGNGLKVVVPVIGGPEMHLDNFLKIENYFWVKYHIAIDQSGKDINRLCFLSYDESAYINEMAKPTTFDTSIKFPVPLNWQPSGGVVVNPAKIKKAVKEPKKPFSGYTLDGVKEHTDKMYDFGGGRNNYTFKFAVNALKYGIPQADTLAYCLSNFVDNTGEHPHTPQEVTATVKSAYTKNANEYGTLVKQPNNSSPIDFNSKPPAKSKQQQQKEKDIDGCVFIQFWKETTREGRNGQLITSYTIDYNSLTDFLETNGFFRLPLKKGYTLIRYTNNICKPVLLVNIKDFVFSYLKEKKLMEILNILRRGSNKYFNTDLIEGLSYKIVQFNRSTATDSYFYFKNCFVRITSNTLTTHPYNELKAAIWDSQVIQRDFKEEKAAFPIRKDGYFDTKNFNCEFARYIALVAHNPENKDVLPEVSRERFFSICSSIGYMLHDHKNRLAKAIVCVDHKIPEDKTEQNGGTGKSIVGNSFKYLRNTYYVDGRQFDEKNQFKFTDLTLDHKLICIQDCKHNLDFGDFFVPITQDFSYRAMYVGNVTIPFEDSPKFWFDSNFTFKGDGPSFRRRMHVIEFDDYFTDLRSPLDEFDHFLFDDWSDVEFNRFYNYYFYCVQFYLDQGLINYPNSNYDNRRMLTECPQEFIDWIDAKDDDGKFMNVKRNSKIDKKIMLQAWNTEAKEMNMTTVSPHMFTKWVKKYCRTNKFSLTVEKTNGKQYFIIGNGTGKVEVEELTNEQKDLFNQ